MDVERLQSHRDFVTVLKRRRKVAAKDIVVHYLMRGDTAFQADNVASVRRLGLAVSKAVGNAVVRNGVKRRFRVLARMHEDALPPGCDIVMRAKPGAASASFRSLDAQVAKSFDDIRAKTSAAGTGDGS